MKFKKLKNGNYQASDGNIYREDQVRKIAPDFFKPKSKKVTRKKK